MESLKIKLKFPYAACTVLLFACLASCSWVTRDFVYSPVDTRGWEYEIQKGFQKSVKHAPVTDNGIHTYLSDSIDLKLSSGYTKRLTSGPFWFPIFPTMMFSDVGVLKIEGDFLSRRGILLIDMSKISVSVQEGGKHSNLQFNLKETNGEYAKPALKKIGPGVRYKFTLLFDIAAEDVDALTIDFDPILADGDWLEIPSLRLYKKAGSFNYDEFTM